MIGYRHFYKMVILLCTFIAPLKPCDTWYDRADTFIAQEKYHEAQVCITQALQSGPSLSASDYFRIANLYCLCGNLTQALHFFTITARLAPDNLNSAYNVAYILKLMGNLDDAIALYNNIIVIDQNHDAAHLGLAFAYLQSGNYIKGWQEHTYNLKKQGKYSDAFKQIIDTNTLRGKKIVLTPEGGLGDSIHFIRYAKRLHDEGAYVIVIAPNTLVPLFSSCPYIDSLVPLGTPTPPCDAHLTLMSAPTMLHDSPDNFANTIPYLYTDPKLSEKWQLRLGPDRNLKIGLCWQSDVHNDSSRIPIARRGIPLTLLEQLNHYEYVSWYSLQKYDGVEQLESVSPTFKITHYDDLDTTHGSFMDSAALIETLDIIITIDSAIAHLAGALGKEVWLMLPYVSDWRWLDDSSTSPWYPTMTIFKQQIPFDWSHVIHAIDAKITEKEKLHKQLITTVSAEVSVGELIDKITILSIKNEQIKDPKKLKNIRTELSTLRATQKKYIASSSLIDTLETELLNVNRILWNIEDDIRDKERNQLFDNEFIQLARSVYFTNDRRMSIKNKINQLCGSRIFEEKSYQDYTKKK